MEIEERITHRGFALLEFNDDYGAKCSLQKSSAADEDKIWFGVDDAEPKILASRAKKHGVETDASCGWVEYPIPEDVSLNTRMHLTRGQVLSLLPYLHRFVDTGTL